MEFRDVTIRYDDESTVFDPPLNWAVRAGENWAVVGGNGTGKTTLVDLISGENMLGYTQDMTLFGRRKGSGESVWSIKQQLGLISTATHMSYADFADPAVIALARAETNLAYSYNGAVAEVETACPADVVLLHGSVTVNESALTGESTPMLKSPLEQVSDEPTSACLSMSAHKAAVVLGGVKLLQHSAGTQPSALQPPCLASHGSTRMPSALCQREPARTTPMAMPSAASMSAARSAVAAAGVAANSRPRPPRTTP